MTGLAFDGGAVSAPRKRFGHMPRAQTCARNRIPSGLPHELRS
jgi:hypothetical protein